MKLKGALTWNIPNKCSYSERSRLIKNVISPQKTKQNQQSCETLHTIHVKFNKLDSHRETVPNLVKLFENVCLKSLPANTDGLHVSCDYS